ncbi:hypothetical protein Q8A67_001719 [Cirrhinus molitorella]|uniref:Uncharacterized protein n=1 Tax=Cirrhinus molitorella TaxID=172907 RepID=A0AA88QBM3_9TELE|nr:hypothetical protein Q8A67_001719 [Cirrhinus molitorella]
MNCSIVSKNPQSIHRSFSRKVYRRPYQLPIRAPSTRVRREYAGAREGARGAGSQWRETLMTDSGNQRADINAEMTYRAPQRLMRFMSVDTEGK